MIFTYMNRETSLNNKNSLKEKNNLLVAVNHPPPENIEPNRSNYTSIRVGNTNPPKFARKILNPQKNPIKHYRRQYTSNSSSRHIDLNTINLPGKTIVKDTDNCPTCDLSNTQFIKNAIHQNNEPCYSTISYQDTDPYLWKTINCKQRIKPSQTIISQNYSSSIESLRERRGQTYENNMCHVSQGSSKNSGECNNNNNDNEYTTKVANISNGSKSISSYRRQSGYNYSDETNTLNNSLCCNNITIKSNSTKCDRTAIPNLLRKKLNLKYLNHS